MKRIGISGLLLITAGIMFGLEDQSIHSKGPRSLTPLMLCYTSILTHGINALSSTNSVETRLSAVSSSLQSLALFAQLTTRSLSVVPKPETRALLTKLPDALSAAFQAEPIFIESIKALTPDTHSLLETIAKAAPLGTDNRHTGGQKKEDASEEDEDADPIPGIMLSNFMNILICGFQAVNQHNSTEDRLDSAAHALQSMATIIGLAFKIAKIGLTPSEQEAIDSIKSSVSNALSSDKNFSHLFCSQSGTLVQNRLEVIAQRSIKKMD